jgi:glycosyltransferase involved in cell wall biosynthesis
MQTGERQFPISLLYAINARIGGHGLDLNAHQELKLSADNNFLGMALAYGNRQTDVPSRLITSLAFHPVRLLSFLSPPFYYDAKKKYIDSVASKQLGTGDYDLFHGWAGNSLRALRTANRMGIPSVLEIPTWHRDKGRVKPADKVIPSQHEKNAKFPDSLFKGVLVTRQQSLEEYDLADLLLVKSECAAKTFLAAGFPEEKLFNLGGAADVKRFKPKDMSDLPVAFSAERPFRAVFCGALIKRKGVHRLLEVWSELALPHAELTLIGSVHSEMKPYIEKYANSTVKVPGFSKDVPEILRNSDAHLFPSECEGSAKTVLEACAAGLAQVATAESGDAVQDDLNGIIVPCDDSQALAAGIRRLYDSPELIRRYGQAARVRAVNELSWDHLRERLADAYSQVLQLRKR